MLRFVSELDLAPEAAVATAAADSDFYIREPRDMVSVILALLKAGECGNCDSGYPLDL